MNVFAPAVLAVALFSTSSACQTLWQQVATPTAPSPRAEAALAFDGLRGCVVLFGGYDRGGARNDTWEFDGSSWSERAPVHRPPGMVGAMDYDRGRGRTVLLVPRFSGAETWEWDGVDWTQRALVHNPPSQNRDVMVYDASRGVMVLFVQGNIFGGGETWEYDGFDWTRRALATNPPQRFGAGMLFDPLRNRVVLHGGFVFGGSPYATWEYDGSQWTAVSTNFGSPAHAEFAFAFDAARRRAVLFGGEASLGGVGAPGTFEYAASTWTLNSAVGPTHRSGAAMVYDYLRQECVMFGGRDLATSALIGDTHRYRAVRPALARTFGQGCAGTSVAPSMLPQPFHVPYLGMPFGVRMFSLPRNQPSFVAIGTSRTQFAGLSLPLPLDGVGMTGCQLFVSIDLNLPATGAGSNASLTLDIPTQASLVGGWFYLQGFVVDVGGNALNLIATRALEARIGSP